MPRSPRQPTPSTDLSYEEFDTTDVGRPSSYSIESDCFTVASLAPRPSFPTIAPLTPPVFSSPSASSSISPQPCRRRTVTSALLNEVRPVDLIHAVQKQHALENYYTMNAYERKVSTRKPMICSIMGLALLVATLALVVWLLKMHLEAGTWVVGKKRAIELWLHPDEGW